MLRYIFVLLLGVTALGAAAQMEDYDYFPPRLCKESGLKMVTVYETKITDPIAQSGPNNRIRLARNAVRQLYFDQNGNRSRALTLTRGGDIIQQEVIFVHDPHGLKRSENLKVYHTNTADSSKVIQNRESIFSYTPSGHVSSQSTYLTSETTRTSGDSIVYIRDLAGKLQKVVVYTFSPMPTILMEKEYDYRAGKVEVLTKIGGQPGNRDEFELDAEGRKVKERNFGPGDTLPRLETHYSYDPRGWLQEIQFIPDWKHFQRNETVISRKNKFDDHGKLVESQYDYGDGKRLFEFYDHSYWVED
jgi:hypothetical protein